MQNIERSGQIDVNPKHGFNHTKLLALAQHHPNKAWLKSMGSNLESGFWPKFDDLMRADRLHIVHNLHQGDLWRSSEDQREIDISYAKEMKENRFTKQMPIENALPGTRFVNPVVVHKNAKVRIAFNHSFPRGSNTNSFIEDETVHMDFIDGLVKLIVVLVQVMRLKSMESRYKLVIRKFDFKAAYRNVALHPIAVLKQAIRLPNGMMCYDKYLSFGLANAGHIWGQVAALFVFILITVCRIPIVFIYIDDIFGLDVVEWSFPEGDLSIPMKRTLALADHIGFKYGPDKFYCGRRAILLGITVDLDLCLLTLPEDKKALLFEEIGRWLVRSNQNIRSIKDFQQFAGWLNWVSTIRTLMRPFIMSLYSSSKLMLQQNKEFMFISAPVRKDLEWIRKDLHKWDGHFLFSTMAWPAQESEFVQFSDACLNKGSAGVGIFWPMLRKKFYVQGRVPSNVNIAQVELWAVVIGLAVAKEMGIMRKGAKVTCFCDNEGAVFAIDQRRGVHHDSLRYLADLEVAQEWSLKCHWVSGKRNVEADRLSRGLFITESDVNLKVKAQWKKLIDFSPSGEQ
jgi:hypothetical protein